MSPRREVVELIRRSGVCREGVRLLRERGRVHAGRGQDAPFQLRPGFRQAGPRRHRLDRSARGHGARLAPMAAGILPTPDHESACHRRLRIHRQQFYPPAAGGEGFAVARLVNLDMLTYAGNPANLAELARRPALCFRPWRHRRRGAGGRLCCRASHRRRRQLCRRVACGSLDRFAGAVCPDQRRRARSACSTRPAIIGAASAKRKKTPFAFSIFQPTKCLAISPEGSLPATEASPYRAQFSPTPPRKPPATTWCGLMGTPTNCLRSRPMPEQLRPLSISGKTHPADDPQRARRQASSGLWRRPASARLALRGRPLRRHLARVARGQTGRDL